MDTISNCSILSGPTKPLIYTAMHKLFENIATTTAADSTALVFEAKEGTRTYTYRRLNNIANRLSKTILQIVLDNNLSANDDGDFIIAVSMHPSDYLVIILLAILKAGAAYLPLDPTFPQVRVHYILEDAKPVLAISDTDGMYVGNTLLLSLEELLNTADDLLYNSIIQEEPLLEEQRLKHQEEGLIVVLYTSGSTGTPKGARITNISILNRLYWQYQAFPITKSETMSVFKTVLTFIDAVSEIWGPLLNGLGIVVVSKKVVQNPEAFVDILERHKIERIIMVPSLFRTIFVYLNLQHNRKLLQNLRIWACGGEPVPVSIAQDFYEYFLDEQHQFCNFYGSTEVMGDITYHVVSRDDLNHPHKVSIGNPVINTIIYLLDNDFRPVKIGEVGEVFIAGWSLPAGYVNDRHGNNFCTNPFSKDPEFARLFRIGDFARIKNGVLWYEGRSDSQVKIRGQRVDLSEIEKVVNATVGVVKGVVLCYKPGEDGQKILAFIVTDESLNVGQIKKALEMNLVSYMVPQMVLVKDIPLLINGKVDRQALLKNYETSQSGTYSDIDYTGVSEDKVKAAKVLFETVARLLDKSDGITISINSNFYESGGTSLNSIFTIAKLREAGYHISVNDFINACNLGEVLSKLCLNETHSKEDTCRFARYRAKPLQDKHKEAVIDMVYKSFDVKSTLHRWFDTVFTYLDYKMLVDKFWETLIEQNLSFVVETLDGKVVGVAVNHDAAKPPEPDIDLQLIVMLAYIHSVEYEVYSALASEEGVTLYALLATTSSDLSPKENVEVMMLMEKETLKLAKRRKFKGVLTSNMSPLTQQLAADIFGYETLVDHQVNQYADENGFKPFAMAPDSERILVQ